MNRSTRASSGPGSAGDRWVAGGAVAMAGLGSVMAMEGLGSARFPLLLGGVAVAAAGVLLLLLARWVDGFPLLLASLPLPALYSSQSARVAPALFVTAALVGVWIIQRGTDGRGVNLGPLPRRAALLLFGAAVLSAAFAQNVVFAVREVVSLGLFLALLVVCTDELRQAPRRTFVLATWIAALGGASGVLAVLQGLGLFPSAFPLAGTSFLRATLGLGQPNGLAMLFSLTLPFTVHVIRTAPGPMVRTSGFLAFGGCLAGLIATFSRGSWLAVLVAPAVLLLVGERSVPLRFWLLVLGGALALDFLAGGAVWARAESLAAGDWVIEQRGALMFAGVLMFMAHPLVGVGPGGFGEALAQFGPQISWLYDYVPSAHNAYVHAAAEMGVLGLVAFVGFLGSTLVVLVSNARRARREGDVQRDEVSLRDTALWAFTTACLVAVVEWPFSHGVGQLVILVAALGLALVPARPAGEHPCGSG